MAVLLVAVSQRCGRESQWRDMTYGVGWNGDEARVHFDQEKAGSSRS